MSQHKAVLVPQAETITVATTPWDLAVAELDNVRPATGLAFHQFEPHVVSADANNMIRWAHRTKTVRNLLNALTSQSLRLAAKPPTEPIFSRHEARRTVLAAFHSI